MLFLFYKFALREYKKDAEERELFRRFGSALPMRKSSMHSHPNPMAEAE
jgi:hypothetical protein